MSSITRMSKRSTHAIADVLVLVLFAACAETASGRSDSARAVRLGDTITHVDTTPVPPRDSARAAQSSEAARRLPPPPPAPQRIPEGRVLAPRKQTSLRGARR